MFAKGHVARRDELGFDRFAAWCLESKGNLASPISGKVAAVQCYHRVEAQVETIATSLLIRCALKGIARSHVEAGTRHRVRLPATWRMLLDDESLIPAWGIGGKSRLFLYRPIRRDLCQ